MAEEDKNIDNTAEENLENTTAVLTKKAALLLLLKLITPLLSL